MTTILAITFWCHICGLKPKFYFSPLFTFISKSSYQQWQQLCKTRNERSTIWRIYMKQNSMLWKRIMQLSVDKVDDMLSTAILDRQIQGFHSSITKRIIVEGQKNIDQSPHSTLATFKECINRNNLLSLQLAPSLKFSKTFGFLARFRPFFLVALHTKSWTITLHMKRKHEHLTLWQSSQTSWYHP